MCVKVHKPSSEVHGDSASLQLTIFILDETGYSASNSLHPCSTTRNYIRGATLVHDLCEDG